ncbi:unnamed protein product [Colias eurytheme]|nr:unnamed protein product [Colias eurytheme]
MSNIVFLLNISKDCAITKAKVATGTVKHGNNTMKKLWNYNLNKPCQHFVLGPILTKAFNLSSNCIILKGHYEVAINMHEISANFLGTSFFYDTYFFKTMAYNDRNNFICVDTVIKISPKEQ